jgi:hypothetical protein
MTKAALIAAAILLALTPSADAKAKRLTNHQLVAAGNQAVADLERQGETVLDGRCLRHSSTSGRCGLTLSRPDEPGNHAAGIDPGTCVVGVSVRLRKGHVQYRIELATHVHVQGYCGVRSG